MRPQSQSFVFRLAYTLGLRLAQVGYIRRAIDDHADLGDMGARLIFRLILGLLIIGGSNIACWPTIGIVTAMSVRAHHPWIAVVGCPLVYGIAFTLCAIGMALAGGKGGRQFLRWRARLWVEWLLSHGPINARRSMKKRERTSQSPTSQNLQRSMSEGSARNPAPELR
jgi:hypothetical protein